MKIRTDRDSLTVDAVTRSWKDRSIRANPEYQRGQDWSDRQGAMLVDSVLRGYPLPMFYFEQKTITDPLGNPSVVLDVIDGQQRIFALTNYRNDNWPLFDPNDSKVALPQAIRKLAAPWAGKTFSALPATLQEQFLSTKLPCVFIEEFGTPEEVRDLFLRLQAGTALTRQQVRDAWPGNLSEWVVTLAGKLQRHAIPEVVRCGRSARLWQFRGR